MFIFLLPEGQYGIFQYSHDGCRDAVMPHALVLILAGHQSDGAQQTCPISGLDPNSPPVILPSPLVSIQSLLVSSHAPEHLLAYTVELC